MFLKTSEEAQSAEDLLFTFQTPSAEILDITTSFDSGSLSTQVLVDGFGFDDTVSLWIDGYEQELVSYTSTLATFKVTNVDYTSTDNIQVYTSEGFPWGSDVIHTLDFTPSLLSITPSTGSSAGSWITVEGTGFGVQS